MIDRHRALLALWFRRLVTAILLVPSAWLLAFGSLVLRERIEFGSWPTAQPSSFYEIGWEPEFDDAVNFETHVEVVACGIPATALCVLLGMVLLLIGIALPRIRAPKIARYTFCVTALTCVALVVFDPGNLLWWFLN